ncbi:MAG: hypothetical protein ACM3O3_04755 [Syntrophothermus sp.]
MKTKNLNFWWRYADFLSVGIGSDTNENEGIFSQYKPIREVVTCYNFYNIQYAKPEQMPGYLDLL